MLPLNTTDAWSRMRESNSPLSRTKARWSQTIRRKPRQGLEPCDPAYKAASCSCERGVSRACFQLTLPAFSDGAGIKPALLGYGGACAPKLMLGLEPRTSPVPGECAASCATSAKYPRQESNLRAAG